MGTPAAESNGGSEHTEALYREHGAAVAALCRSLLRDRAEAEDATQQVFLSAHRALLNGAVPREPRAWLLGVARNECYMRFRQRATRPMPAGETPDGATADASVDALRADELARVWDEVGRMPAAQREAFLLREIRGLSYGQVADQLSLSKPSVRSLLLRARARLRHRLGGFSAALGGAPWVQALVRLVASGDGPSPLPAATKAAAVGLGALALAGSAATPHAVHPASPHASHHASRPSPIRSAPRHRAGTHVRHVASPNAVPVASHKGRSGRIEASGEHARRHDDGSNGSGSGQAGSHEGSDDGRTGAPLAAPVAQPTTTSDGHDGGGSSGSGSGDATTTTTTTAATTVTTDGGGDGGHSGSDSGSDSSSSGGSSDGHGGTDGHG